MRVATFNIHHGTVGSDGPVDADRLAEVCAGFDADVLALQEVDVNTERIGGADLTGAVARATGTVCAFGPSIRLGSGWYGNALFVRGDLERRVLHRLPRTPPGPVGGRLLRRPKAREPRSVLVASARVGGLELTVAATHLAVEPDLGEVHLEALAGLVAAEDGPLLVLGDLNREAREIERHARRVGLSLADHGPTQPARRPRRAIDHILVSPELVIIDVEVRLTSMSDHRALIAEVEPVARR